MIVHTNIKRLDLIHFNLVLLPRLRSTYVAMGMIASVVFVFFLWESGVPKTAPSWMVMILASLGGGIGGMVAGTIVAMRFILATSSKSNGILGEHEYELTSEGLLEKTNVNEGLSRWSGIREVRKVGSFVLFRISGYLFHVIPRRSFESEDAFLEFIEKAKREWRRAA